jgi:uncharacterized membrane protein
MKKLTLLLVFVALFIQSPLFAQSDSTVLFKRKNDLEPRYLRKIESYRKLRNTGFTLGVIGTALTVTGIVMISNTDWQKQSNNGSTTYVSNDSKGLVGILATIVGVPLLATGSVLGGIGAHKMKQYSKKLDNVSLHLNCTPNQQGFALTYRF